MVRIEIDLKKSVEENASSYYDQSKKLRAKREGILKILEKSKKDIEKLEKQIEKENKKEQEILEIQSRKKAWYENFRWFLTSNGHLCIGGRDATTNEIIIKKHMQKEDLVFHTDMAGSPFFLIKADEKPIIDLEKEEVAITTASYSKAWKNGLAVLDVFYVNPDQVTKTTKSGEFMSKGSFMITGKTNYIHPKITLAIGITEDGRIMGGAPTAVAKNCIKSVRIAQGREKTSAAAKKIQKLLGGGELDEIIRNIPAGGVQVRRG